ncbi:MAG: PQQ-dependent sugar dehydrogenase [Chloroflexi bacterium]|nr:PQQ-dependent sugar dehydrogenase [Chloroflexota bacterium]
MPTLIRVSIFLLMLALVACASPAPTPTAAPTPVPTRAPVATAAPTAAPTVAPANAPAPVTTTPSVAVFAKGLDTPWAIDFAPDGRAFLTERLGAIRIIQDGKLQTEPWMKLPVAETGEAGLLGLALDSQFANNRFVYVAYTYRNDAGRLLNRLVRLREENGKGVLDKILLDNIPGNSTHDGGRVRFGPDGKLYWTMGDAQNQPAAQDPAALNGKILRLNADGTIPGDNPFPNSPVYSYGHRNPQGLAWQPGTNRLYATEHGPSGGAECCRDEINFIEPGKNYGWSIITGDRTHEGMLAPVMHSGNSTTWAPSGATFVTRGPWAGSFVFVGLRGQALYRVTFDKDNPRKVADFKTSFNQQYGRLRDVVEGPDGALYVLSSNADGRGSVGADGDVVLRVTFR